MGTRQARRLLHRCLSYGSVGDCAWDPPHRRLGTESFFKAHGRLNSNTLFTQARTNIMYTSRKHAHHTHTHARTHARTHAEVLAGTAIPGEILAVTDTPGGVLAGTDIPGGVLAGTDIPGGVLAGTCISGEVLAGTYIPGGVLAGTDIPGAVLAGTAIPGEVLAGTDIPGGWGGSGGCTCRYTVTTRMTALGWAAMRVTLMFY